MVKRKYFILLLALSVMLFCCGTVYAMTAVSVINPFETGIVDISLTEYEKKDTEETLYTDSKIILPGDIISKIPRIHNDGNDCYVRAKIIFRGTVDISVKDLFGMSDKWILSDDGYYYYTEILPHGKDVDIFEGLKIPEDFPQEAEGEVFYLDIDADAIQSQNFNPQFDRASPWGDVEILECEKEGQYDVSTFKPSDSKSFEIVYEFGTDKLVVNEDDFFANIPYLMPGDTYTDTVKIKNEDYHNIKLYFRSEQIDDSELLKKIGLKITAKLSGTDKETFVYEGNLKAEDLSEDVLLSVIGRHREAEFKFEINVPAELNNKYSIENSKVKWIFSADYIPIYYPDEEPEEENPEIPPEDEKPEKPEDPEDDKTSEETEKPTSVPKTGDAMNMTLWIFMMACSLILFIIAVLGLKLTKEERSE